MPVHTIGVISAGDMGSGIGRTLHDSGANVVTCLEGRSELTRLRAAEASMRDAGSLDALVQEADLVLSVLVPSEASAFAEQLADAMRRTGARPVFADCNAIAPQTVVAMTDGMADLGVTFIDAGIIGGPPKPGGPTRFYCSGPDTGPMEALAEHGLNIHVVGPEIGQASGLKMVYAASTKGMTALWTELLVAARALGLEEALMAEFGMGRGGVAEFVMGQLPSMPRRSRRWVGEMEEIAATFEALGMTPRILLGAADVFSFVGETALADQTEREPNPTLDAILDTLTGKLSAGG